MKVALLFLTAGVASAFGKRMQHIVGRCLFDMPGLYRKLWLSAIWVVQLPRLCQASAQAPPW